MATRAVQRDQLKALYDELHGQDKFQRPGWGAPPADAAQAVLELNQHLAPAGMQIKAVSLHGMNIKKDDASAGLYTLVNTLTDAVAAKSTRWELWEQKALVQIYHTLRKPSSKSGSISRVQVERIVSGALTKHKAHKHLLVSSFIEKALEGRWLMSANDDEAANIEAGKVANSLQLGPRAGAELLDAYEFDEQGLTVAVGGGAAAAANYDSDAGDAPAAASGGGSAGRRKARARSSARAAPPSDSEGELGGDETDESDEGAAAAPPPPRRGAARARGTKRGRRQAADLPSDDDDSEAEEPAAIAVGAKRARRRRA